MRLRLLSSLLLASLFVPRVASTESGVADPAKHPYADPARGRDGYALSGETVNEARLYDFYSRQADYYMSRPRGEVPKILPAYPGLDAGRHGHWGKHNENSHNDGRLNDQDYGSMVIARLQIGRKPIHKAVHVRLGLEFPLSAAFDPWTLTYRRVWRDGFVKFSPYRWGVSRGVTTGGQVILEHSGVWDESSSSAQKRLPGVEYRGFYRHGDRVVFSYARNGVEVLDHPWAEMTEKGIAFTRHLAFPKGLPGGLTLPLAQFTGRPKIVHEEGLSTAVFEESDKAYLVGLYTPNTGKVAFDDGQVFAQFSGSGTRKPTKPSTAKAFIWSGPKHDLGAVTLYAQRSFARLELSGLTKGGKPKWPEKVTLAGKRAADDLPYVIDRLPVPFKNPFQSVMMLSGIDFLPNGDALVATLMGDIWLVSGIDDDLKKVTWKRFAAGLYQPFGIDVVDGKIYVLAKDALYVLHDLNGDGEADFYENYANDFVETHSHTHIFGLDRDAKGNFYFPSYDLFYKLPPDGSGVKLFAKGFRNCMAVATRSDGLVLAAPQEGTWTPGSMIIEVREGEHYGFKRTNEPIAPPMCFVPRGVDASTGGMVFVDSDRFGPLGKSILGLSYGYGSHYAVLRDETVSRAQGAVVPLEGEFVSGVHRGRIRAQDGQLYVVGCDGWGNYALEDGSLARVRYTGKKLYKPSGFRIHRNGVRIDFTEPLDARAASKLENWFAQAWNYEYASRYGSPELSVQQPSQLGHDRLDIRTVRVLEGGKSVFVEIPLLVPCKQLQIRMHLQAADGHAFRSNLFATVLELGERFDFEGAAIPVHHKPKKLRLRVRESGKIVEKFNDPKIVPKRTIVIRAQSGLRYDKTTIVAAPGEPIAIRLENTDGMPHNLVVVQPGAYEQVGLAAFRMMNDPAAFEKSYVPESPDVIAYTRVVFPESSHTIKIHAPKEPGRYPFLCTFPGHWQSMTGQLIVLREGEELPEGDAGDAEGVLTIEKELLAESPASLAKGARAKGDATRGAALFFEKKMSCATCHAPEKGPRLGPDLAAKRDGVTDEFLVDSILRPSKSIRAGFESLVVMTKTGHMRSGFRVATTDGSVALRDPAAQGEVVRFQKADIVHAMPGKTSMMPTGLVHGLRDRQRFLDLVRFLIEVDGGGAAKLEALRPKTSK